jgi:hypothetical protein
MIGLEVAKGLRMRYNAQNGKTYVALDDTTKRQLREAYSLTMNGNCGWRFCPGPEAKRVTPMATCSKCAAAITLRRTLDRLEITP